MVKSQVLLLGELRHHSENRKEERGPGSPYFTLPPVIHQRILPFSPTQAEKESVRSALFDVKQEKDHTGSEGK